MKLPSWREIIDVIASNTQLEAIEKAVQKKLVPIIKEDKKEV